MVQLARFQRKPLGLQLNTLTTPTPPPLLQPPPPPPMFPPGIVENEGSSPALPTLIPSGPTSFYPVPSGSHVWLYRDVRRQIKYS